MRLTDTDALLVALVHGHYIDKMQCGEIKRMVERYTIDAVPVIRCKDCKFSKAYYHGSESNLGMFTYLCTQGLYGMNADDYCSRAERKDNGKTD